MACDEFLGKLRPEVRMAAAAALAAMASLAVAYVLQGAVTTVTTTVPTDTASHVAPAPAVRATTDVGASDDAVATWEARAEAAMDAEAATYAEQDARREADDATTHVDDVSAEISDVEERLADARDELATAMHDDYVSGDVTLTDIFVAAEDVDDAIMRTNVAERVVRKRTEAVENLVELERELGEKRAEQMEAIVALEQANATYEQTRQDFDEATNVVESYDSEFDVWSPVDEELRSQAVSVVTQSSEPYDDSGPDDISVGVMSADDAGTDASDGCYDESYGYDSSDSSDDGYDYDDGYGGYPSYPGESSDMLDRAYSMLGAGYQWSGYNYTGDASTSSFTCSGIVDYALGRESWSSSPESLYAEVGENMRYDVSELEAGDLVFYPYKDREVGHVGIYVGNGQVLDSIPNGGVAIRDVDYMPVVGGGSLC